MNHIKNLGSQTLVYGLSSIVPRFLTYLLNPLYTYSFHRFEDIGKVSLLYTYVIFLNIILTYGMETGFFYHAKNSSDHRIVFGTAFYSLLFSTTLFVVVSFVFIRQLSSLIEFTGNQRYVEWFIYIIAFDTLSAIPFSKLRFLNKAFRFAFIKFSSVIINVLINVILIWVIPTFLLDSKGNILGYHYQKDIELIFISNVISSIITLVLLFPEIFKEKLLFDFKLLLKMLGYSLPLMVAGLAGTINDTMDRILLQHLLPAGVNAEAEIGIFWANTKLAVIMLLFIQMFRFAAEPFFFNQKSGTEQNIVLADVTKYFILYGLIIFLGVTCYLDILKYFVGPSGYWVGLKVVPIYLLAKLCLGIYYNLSFWYKLSGKTYFGILLTAIGAFFSVTLNIILIPFLSYFGCAIVHLASYLIMTATSYFIGKKYLNIPYDIKRISFYLGISLFLFFIVYYLKIPIAILNILKNTIILVLFLVFLEKREHIFSLYFKK